MDMAHCLNRTDSEAIRRDDFFSMHNTNSKLIDPDTLCISTLGRAEICSEPIGDQPQTLADSTSDKVSTSESLNESGCKNKHDKQPTEMDFASGFFVLNKDCGVSPLEHYERPVNNHSTNSITDVNEDTGNGNENSIMLESSDSFGDDKFKTCAPDDPHSSEQEDGSLENKFVDGFNSEGDKVSSSEPLSNDSEYQDKEKDLVSLHSANDQSNDSISKDSHVSLESSCGNSLIEHKGEPTHDLLSDNNETVSERVSELNSESNSLYSDSGSEIICEHPAEEENIIESSCDTTGSKEEFSQSIVEVEMTHHDDGNYEADSVSSNKNSYSVDSCYVVEEVVIDKSYCMHDDSSNSLLEDGTVLHETRIEEESNESNIEKGTVPVAPENKKELCSSTGIDNSDVTGKDNIQMISNENLSKSEIVTVDECISDTVSRVQLLSEENCDMTDSVVPSSASKDLRIDSDGCNPVSASRPSEKGESKCSIQLVPKIERPINDRTKYESNVREKRKARFKGGFAERLESLTRTVKIGCLSVTPLNPSIPTHKDESNIQSSDPCMANEEDQISVHKFETQGISNASHFDLSTSDHNKPSTDSCKNVPLFLKTNEKLMKNNVEITISPKTACTSSNNYSGNSADTLKVKIPQLIESCTGKSEYSVHRDTFSSSKPDFDKNFIVNKNLKVIESFLVQKGFQREASILKEKTGIIKPYLEDIALKLEKSINERSVGGSSDPDLSDIPTAEFTNFINEYKRSEQADSERSVEKELSAMTEKFLKSPAVNIKMTPRNSDEPPRGPLKYSSYPYGYPSTSDKGRYHDNSVYGKAYHDALDYLTKRELSLYPRVMDLYKQEHYRSSRYQTRESDFNYMHPEMTMYDQFLPEFDNKLHPSLASSNTFRNSDFSLFIDAYTAEKYSNFIHFMVPDSEVAYFEMMECSKMDSETNQLVTVQPLDRRYPTVSHLNQFCTPVMSQYQNQTVPMMPPYSQSTQRVSPAIGHPLPMDSARESCGQLTITPLDGCGKPYAQESQLDGCSSQPYSCNDQYSCSHPFVPGPLPLPQTLDSSHQLTITPLHQSSNLPYLHRSAGRRRGRPPMDPDYDVVGYRKDAYANVRFSRADFMARCYNNVDSIYPDGPVRISKLSNDGGGSETKPPDVKPILDVGSIAETNTVPPPVTAPVVATIPVVVAPPVVATLPVVALPPPLPITVASPSVSTSNGYRRIKPRPEHPPDQITEKQTQFVEIAPRPVKVTSDSKAAPVKPNLPFKMMSRQVKIKPNTFLHNTSVKICLIDKALKKTHIVPSKQTEVSKKTPELSGILKRISGKNIPGLENVLSNSNITLKTVEMSTPSLKKVALDSLRDITETPEAPIKPKSTINKISLVTNIETRNIGNPTEEGGQKEICCPKDSIPDPLNSDSQTINSLNIDTFDKNNISALSLKSKQISSIKSKRRRRLTFNKRKKVKAMLKNPVVVQKKVKKMSKVVNDSPVIKVNEDIHSVTVNINCSKESDIITNELTCDSPDKSGDGIRRSGRKRKIIEGNPKFRDMERVDLKYFREERAKSAVKRKAKEPDAKAVAKPDSTMKKKILSEAKAICKEQKHSNNIEGKALGKLDDKIINNQQQKDNELRPQEKLQQFLDVNDIYLKPQTFI